MFITFIILRFYDCRSLSAVTFERGSRLSRIAARAFSDCSSLSFIYIPSSVQRLCGFCFCGCTSLSKITFGPDSELVGLDLNVFTSCSISSLSLASGIQEVDPVAHFTVPQSCQALRAFL